MSTPFSPTERLQLAAETLGLIASEMARERISAMFDHITAPTNRPVLARIGERRPNRSLLDCSKVTEEGIKAENGSAEDLRLAADTNDL